MKKISIHLLLIGMFQSFCFSQNLVIDSLNLILKSSAHDTSKVKAYNALFLEFEFEDEVKAKDYLTKALELSKKNGYKKGLGITYMYLGFLADDKSDFFEALKNYQISLKTFTSINDFKGQAGAYNSLGSVFYIQGNYPEALKNHFSALKLREVIRDKNGIAQSYGNIGNVYNSQENYPLAIKNYFFCLNLMKDVGNKKGIATTYNNIALIYSDQKNYSESLKNHFEGLKIRQEIKDEKGVAGSYNNIGLVYYHQGKNDEALKNYFMSLKIKEVIEDEPGIAGVYCNIGEIYAKQKKYKEAETILEKAKKLSLEIGYRENLRQVYKTLTEMYASKGNYQKAFEAHVLFVSYRDSLNNEETREKTIQNQMTYDFDKKDAIAKAEHKKELESQHALSEEKNRKQNLFIIFVVTCLILVIAFAVFIFRSLNLTQKQKKIIERQKDHSEYQRLMVEEKQKDIIDSINYAKRIQLALLKEEEHVSEHLPEHFILFKPKDIVSGDFYWAFEKNEYWYLAAADCTGHGVPGAFMSMLGIAFLNEISASIEVLSPAKILDLLRNKIVKELGQNGKEGESKDGMDISLMCYNTKSMQLQWSGANNSLYILKGNDLTEIKANKQPIGFHEAMQPFTNHIIDLNKSDSVYLFTDGFADQFGGPKGKKFKYSKLKELLVSINSKSLAEQKGILNEEFEVWKLQLEQTDDVCLIGVKF